MSMICEFWALTREEIQKVSNMSDDDFCEHFLEEHPADADINKAWDGLDYLLRQATGNEDFPVGFFHVGTPLGLLVDYLGDGDPGARWFNEEETATIAEFLDSFNRSRLHDHFDPQKMEEARIYPDIWADENEDAFDWLYDYFETIRDFFRKTADAGLCVMTILG